MAAFLAVKSVLSPLDALIGEDPGIGGSDEGAGVGRSCIISTMAAVVAFQGLSRIVRRLSGSRLAGNTEDR